MTLTEPRTRLPIERLIACAKRELAMRKMMYPKRVAQGEMTVAEECDEIDAMVDIIHLLEVVAGIFATRSRDGAIVHGQ